ncbi:unnamed protein product, partial [Ascophyllum nodosum]
QNTVKNFLTIGTRDRLRLVIFVLLFVAPVLLWPILFCAKVDGETSSSWVALWTPLWIYNALGLWYFVYPVSLGEINMPEGVEENWTDPYPLPLRTVALVKWAFQIFLTLRFDDDIDWSYATTVVAPLLGWGVLTLLAHTILLSSVLYISCIVVWIADGWCVFLPVVETAFLILYFEGQYESSIIWRYLIVFVPTWVVLFGQLAGFCIDFMLASKLASGIEGKEDDDLTEVRQGRDREGVAVAAAEGRIACFIKKQKSLRIGFTVITVILAVAAIAGADYSAYVIFIPLFVITGLLVCCMTCIIC